MQKSTYRKSWTKGEIQQLESYVKKKSEILRQNFYKNILINKMKHRRSPRFFIQMSQSVGRSASQCKSKFQKFERVIYTEFLDLPSDHYQVYSSIRNQSAQGAGILAREINDSGFENKQNEANGRRKERVFGGEMASEDRTKILKEIYSTQFKTGFYQTFEDFKRHLSTSGNEGIRDSLIQRHLENSRIRRQIIELVLNGSIKLDLEKNGRFLSKLRSKSVFFL